MFSGHYKKQMEEICLKQENYEYFLTGLAKKWTFHEKSADNGKVRLKLVNAGRKLYFFEKKGGQNHNFKKTF